MVGHEGLSCCLFFTTSNIKLKRCSHDRLTNKPWLSAVNQDEHIYKKKNYVRLILIGVQFSLQQNKQSPFAILDTAIFFFSVANSQYKYIYVNKLIIVAFNRKLLRLFFILFLLPDTMTHFLSLSLRVRHQIDIRVVATFGRTDKRKVKKKKKFLIDAIFFFFF